MKPYREGRYVQKELQDKWDKGLFFLTSRFEQPSFASKQKKGRGKEDDLLSIVTSLLILYNYNNRRDQVILKALLFSCDIHNSRLHQHNI
jgi:hypothetical protein